MYDFLLREAMIVLHMQWTCVCMFVRPSVPQLGVLSEWLNKGSHKEYHTTLLF